MKRLLARVLAGMALLACFGVLFVLWRDRPRSHAPGTRSLQGTATWRATGAPYAGQTRYYSDGSSADTSDKDAGAPPEASRRGEPETKQ